MANIYNRRLAFQQAPFVRDLRRQLSFSTQDLTFHSLPSPPEHQA
jgi:hypothetical protein